MRRSFSFFLGLLAASPLAAMTEPKTFPKNLPVTSHAYTYDAVNRRTQAKLEDGSAWNYGYNDRNELTAANRLWFDATAVTGQQFGYNYDNLGNRQTASFGAGVPPVSYSVNSLNQYTGVVTPGLKDILGAALATNGVTVNGGTADRKGEYFHRQISVGNTNQPVWQDVTNISGTFTNKGGLVFPANNQTLVYDADGNLTFDGVWTYSWDGENRLASMWMTNGIAGIAASNVVKLKFAYDYLGRRVSKMVFTWTASGFDANATRQMKFVYDGWNLKAELSANNSILRSYSWGNDLSGTMSKAGGVGGLLMANISGTNCFAGYDGNGNITAFINASDKSLSARYEYSPYGQLIRETGLLASQIPFRYSTKFWDEESGLVYYPSRYYSPNLGRWINRDPTTDQVFLALYLFCHNNPIGRFDIDGRVDWLEVEVGFLEMLGGAAEAGAAGLADFFTAGVATPVAVLGVVGGGLTFAHGFVQFVDGLSTKGDISPSRKAISDMPDSIGGWSGLAIGGMTGKAVGHFVEQTINMCTQANELLGGKLTKIIAAEFGKQMLELWDSEFDVLDTLTGNETAD